MVNLQAKGRKEAEAAAARLKAQLRVNGFTIFKYDFNPKFTRRDLSLGDALRELKRLTGWKVGFWRCPVRGMAVEFREPPRTKHAWDHGDKSRLLRFSVAPDERTAKMELVLEVVLAGIGYFRGLPNEVYDSQVSILRGLLTAPPSVDAGQWLEAKTKLEPRLQQLLKTHEADLRQNLLGEQY